MNGIAIVISSDPQCNSDLQRYPFMIKEEKELRVFISEIVFKFP